MGTGIEDVFGANVAPVGKLQEMVHMQELLRSKDAEIEALKQELREGINRILDALVESMEDCSMCENQCESYALSKAYKEARGE